MSPVQFKSPSAGGDWYTPERMGMYRMKLVDIVEGDDLGYGPTVKWRFQMFNMDGTPIRYTPTGGENAGKEIDAISDGLTSFAMGKKAKARSWFGALLARPILDTDDVNLLQVEAIGKEVIGSWGPNDNNKIVIQALMPI